MIEVAATTRQSTLTYSMAAMQGTPRHEVPGNSLQLQDRVEISESARESGEPKIREQLVQRIRQEIANNRYLTYDKITVAVKRLHAVLTGR
jgi:hypothetical protein